MTTIGATALGFGIVIGGSATAPPVVAQEDAPAVEAPAQAGDPDELRAEAYDAFVASLASELSVDDAEVDAAIRTALKEQIAQQANEGNLDAELASDLEEMIDNAEAPLPFGMLGMGGRGAIHVFKGGHFEGRGEHRGPHGGFDDRDDRTSAESESETAPASLPSDDAADQGTTADEATPEGDATS